MNIEDQKQDTVSRTTLDHMLEGCQIIGPDWRYIYLNNAAVKQSTLRKDQLIGHKFTDVWPGIENTKVYTLIDDCMKSGLHSRFDNKFAFPDGKIGWFDLSIQPIPEGVFILSIDITEKKAFEENLIASEEKFRTVFEAANVGKTITLSNGHVTVNQAFCNMIGYSKEELESKTWKDYTPEKDIPVIEKKLAPIHRGDKNKIRFLKRYIHKKGNTVWVDISMVMHRDSEGNPLFLIATIIDISKQKESEEEVILQKELLEEMGKIARIGAWELDPATGEGTWSEEVARIHDLKPEGKTDLEIALSFYTPESKLLIEKAIFDAVNEKKPYELDLQIITAKGNRKWVRTLGKPLVKNNRVVKLQGSFQDITDRKNAENEKTRYAAFLDTIIEQSPFAMWISDPQGYIIRTNASLREKLKIPEGDFVGKYNVFNDPNFHDQNAKQKVQKTFHDKQSVRFIINWKSGIVKEIFFKKNTDLWIDIALIPIIDHSGNIVNVVCQWLDITKLKKAQEILRISENRLKNAQSIAKIGNYIWNIENDQISLSKSLCHILDLDARKAIDFKSFRQILHHPEDSHKFMIWMQRNLNSDQNILSPLEYRILKENGTTIYVRAMGEIKRRDGKPIEVTATIQDITESKLAELEIHKLNEELEQRVSERTAQLDAKNKELQTFTYSVSHDLKAPLRGIDGYSKMLSELYSEAIDDEARIFIRNIRQSTLQMNQLIEDLLAYSKLERSSSEKDTFNGKEFISNIVDSFRKDIEDKNLCLKNLAPSMEIYADSKSLAMALRNIIDNAIKFSSESDSPEITIETKSNENSVTISVADNGIGFDQKFSEKIFEIFQRLERSEDYSGTGIGLAMAYKAVDQMNGKIWATGQLGKGATFYIEIPNQ